jgi:protein O-GlcNAc transferase
MDKAARELVLNVRGGARVCVPADLRSITAYVLAEQEDWFEDEIAFVRRLLKPGMRAIDAGASYGLYTLAMAGGVGRSGQVWAFEPMPGSADFLERTLKLNGAAQVELVREALSDGRGKVSFAGGGEAELAAVVAAGAAEVKATSLDGCAALRGGGGIDFLKIDVEGHEAQVVQGGRALLGEHSPLIMFEVVAAGHADLRVLEPLRELGYSFYRLLPGPLLLAPFEAAQPLFQLNLFAAKPDRAAKLASQGLLATDTSQLPAAGLGAWGKYARRAAYARAPLRRWPSGPVSGGRAGQAAYFDALAAFAHARDGNAAAWLGRAQQLALEALQAADGASRRLSMARIAWELGDRGLALESLRSAARALGADAAQVLEEPFLAPSPRYERLTADSTSSAWLQCAVMEQCEKLRAWSSMFAPQETAPGIRAILGLPLRSPEMDRRWQLAHLLLDPDFQPAPPKRLRAGSDENLNPELWANPRRLRAMV